MEDDDLPVRPRTQPVAARPPSPAEESADYEESEEVEAAPVPVVAPVAPVPVVAPPPGSGTSIDVAFSAPPPPLTPVTDQILDSVRDYSVVVDHEKMGESADELIERWMRYPRDYPSGNMLHCAYQLYGYSVGEDVTEERLASKEREFLDKALYLSFRMVTEGIINHEAGESDLGTKLTRIMETVSNMATLIRVHCRIRVATVHNVSAATVKAIHKWNLELTASAEEAKPYQKLLLFLLNTAYERNLRKYKGRLYKQIVVREQGRPPYRTHAWEVDCEVADFVYSAVQKEKDIDMWMNMTSSHANVTSAVAYIKSCKDFEVETLAPDRHVFSFKNAVYDASNNTVYEFSEEGCRIPASLVSAKYFNIDFPVDLVSEEDVDWRDIPTPKLDSILAHQKVPTEPYTVKKKRYVTNAQGRRTTVFEEDLEQPQLSVMDWFYVFIGRMIYEIGEHDDWQVLLFIKGVAGSGKSTLGKIVSYLYDANDVGVLSNNTEKKFGLSQLVDKLIYVCYEVKNDFQLDQGEFQCMVSGEQMSIPFKHEMAQAVTWKTHGMFMGNELASWCDNSGSMSRRIVMAQFDQIVTDGNPKLFLELQNEMGNILLKSNRAYREAAFAFGTKDIWNCLPPYFADNRRKLRAETHPLAFFFANSDSLIFEPTAYVSLNDLKVEMKRFISNEGTFKTVTKAFTADFYQWVMEAWELRVEQDVRPYRDGKVVSGLFVTGVACKEFVFHLNPDGEGEGGEEGGEEGAGGEDEGVGGEDEGESVE